MAQQLQKADPWEPPCLIEKLPFADYLALDFASSHALGTLLSKSPKHVKEAVDKPSKAKGLGTLVHALVLEPEAATGTIAVMPKDAGKGSNAAKKILVDWLAGITGKVSRAGLGLAAGVALSAQIDELTPYLDEMSLIVSTQADFDIAQRMRDNVLETELGRVIFADGKAETTIIAADPETGVLCKIRPDWLPEGHDVIVDLKTAASAAHDDFSTASGRYRYHMQAALYRSIHSAFTGKPRPAFLHTVVENEPPYDCCFYELPQKELAAGENKIRVALERWKRCEDSGLWPGIGYNWSTGQYEIQPLSLKPWAL